METSTVNREPGAGFKRQKSVNDEPLCVTAFNEAPGYAGRVLDPRLRSRRYRCGIGTELEIPDGVPTPMLRILLVFPLQVLGPADT